DADVGDVADALLRLLRQTENHQVITSMNSSPSKQLFFCTTALLLAGCAVGPNYKRPAVNAPGGFRDAENHVSTNSLADLPWWGVFKDPALQDLIHVALTN